MAYDGRNYDASAGLQPAGSGSLYWSGGSRGAYDHLGPAGAGASTSRPTGTLTRTRPVAASDMKTCDTHQLTV